MRQRQREPLMLHSEIDAKLVLVSARNSRGADHAVSRHHNSRASLRVRALSVRHPGNNLRSAIVRHQSLSPFMFFDSAVNSATRRSANQRARMML